MAMFLSDLRSAWRLLLRIPGVALVAIVSLALGIGANTTVFTLVKAVLLQPMPIRDIDRVVVVTIKEMRNGALTENPGTSRLNFEDLRGQANVFSDADHGVHADGHGGRRGAGTGVRSARLRRRSSTCWAPRWRQAAASGREDDRDSGPGRSPCCPTGSGSGDSGVARTSSGRASPSIAIHSRSLE